MQTLSGEVVEKAKGGEANMPPSGSCLFYIGCPGLLPSEEEEGVLLQGPGSGGGRSYCLSQNQNKRKGWWFFTRSQHQWQRS